MQKPHAIYIAFDDNYSHYAKSCLNSLSSNYPNYPHIIVNYLGHDSGVLEFLRSFDRLEVINLETEWYFDLGPVKNKIIYNRFRIFSDYFAGFDSILYLDVDTIIAGSLDHFFHMRDFYAVADNDPFSRVFSANDFGLQVENRDEKRQALNALLAEDKMLDFDVDGAMLNSGVMLIPLAYRNQQTLKQLLAIGSRYSNYIAYADQSILSIWAWLNSRVVSRNYLDNCQIEKICGRRVPSPLNKVVILHFSGGAKARYFRSDQHYTVVREIYNHCNMIRNYYRIRRSGRSELDQMLAKLENLRLALESN